MTERDARSYHPPAGYMLVPAEGYPPIDKRYEQHYQYQPQIEQQHSYKLPQEYSSGSKRQRSDNIPYEQQKRCRFIHNKPKRPRWKVEWMMCHTRRNPGKMGGDLHTNRISDIYNEAKPDTNTPFRILFHNRVYHPEMEVDKPIALGHWRWVVLLSATRIE